MEGDSTAAARAHLIRLSIQREAEKKLNIKLIILGVVQVVVNLITMLVLLNMIPASCSTMCQEHEALLDAEEASTRIASVSSSSPLRL